LFINSYRRSHASNHTMIASICQYWRYPVLLFSDIDTP
jgi:hypothetical protein